MTYTSYCPVCNTEKFYNFNLHTYIPIKGSNSYVCSSCETLLFMFESVPDPQNPHIIFHLESQSVNNPGILYVQRLTHTGLERKIV